MQTQGIDWEGLKRLAVVELGIPPAQFGQLTFGELRMLADAKHKREEREMERLAWLISWLTAPHVKKPIGMDKILGRKSRIQKMTREERKAEMDWLRQRFKKGRAQT